MVDVRPGVGPCVLQDLLDHVGRHFLQKVRGVVGHQVVDDAGRFTVGQRLNDILLVIQLQVRKYIRCHILGQKAEHLEGILILHLVHNGSDIRCLHIGSRLAELGILLIAEQFQQDVLFVL